MTRNYLDILAETIRNNWDQPALTDFYLTEDGTAQDTSRGNHYTYGEMYAEIVRVADLLTRLGLQKGDHVAICGANSSHWVIAYLAIAKMQGVSVTVMHSLQPEQIAQMVDFSDAKALFVDPDLWEELKEQSLPQIQSVISFESWQILRGEKVEIPNRKSLINNRECGFLCSEPDDLAMICFTSGSSGKPKGVMHTNRSIAGGISGSISTLPNEKKKNYLSILPLAHIFGLIGDIDHLLNAHHIIHTLISSPKDVFRALVITSPYVFVSVPQVLEKLYSLRPDFLTLFRQIGIEGITNGGSRLNHDMEKIILNNHFPLVSLYGTTEGMIFSGSKGNDYRSGSCGQIVECMTCRIAPNGEILVKGENVMLGYYKDPEATAAKIDKDGWLHTGDKGYLDEDGYLYVEGRLEQDIIVLPNGENIRPDNIESLINALPEVSESIVVARDGKLVAIVVPDKKIINLKSEIINIGELRRNILRAINPQLPLFSQLYDVEITDQPLQRTEKQTIKRYLYK